MKFQGLHTPKLLIIFLCKANIFSLLDRPLKLVKETDLHVNNAMWNINLTAKNAPLNNHLINKILPV
jgi:hypothetical protein